MSRHPSQFTQRRQTVLTVEKKLGDSKEIFLIEKGRGSNQYLIYIFAKHDPQNTNSRLVI